MNGVFLACDVLKLFTIVSKLLEAETKLKLTYVIHWQAFSIKLDYVILLKYMYIFSWVTSSCTSCARRTTLLSFN
jgi:hypothetical protein